MKLKIHISVALCIMAVFIALSNAQKDYEVKRAFPRDCGSGYSLTCLKLDIVSFIEKMSETKEYNLMPGVRIVRDIRNTSKNSEIVAEMARTFPNDAEKRLNGFLLAKVSDFLQSYSLNLKLLDPKEVDEAKSVYEARKGGGKGKKGGIEALIAAACMMKSMMMAIALGGLALLAGKALMTALMALMLSAIIGLKALTSGGKQTTYEIIAKPVYTQSHSMSHEDVHGHGGGGGGGGHSGYGGYGRSINFVLPEHLTKE